MKDWEGIKNKLVDEQFNSLNKSYDAEVELARNKEKSSDVIYKRTSEDYNRLINDNEPFQGSIYKLIEDIEDIMDLNKTIDFSSAFEKHITSYNQEDKLKIIGKLAKIEGTKKFCDYLIDKKNKAQFEHNSAISAMLYNETKENPEFTTRRQVLAVHYLLKAASFEDTDKSEKARFIQFITGKEQDTAKIKDTYLYKIVTNPFPMSDKQLNKDLQFIRTFFENLGLNGIVDQINKEIGSK